MLVALFFMCNLPPTFWLCRKAIAIEKRLGKIWNECIIFFNDHFRDLNRLTLMKVMIGEKGTFLLERLFCT